MKELKFNDIRKEFLDYFESKDHIRLKSYSLIPNGDKSLLLINAGMAPLKEYFMGTKKFSKPRATSSQKCIRTGDIDNVGKTHRHATFFEMIGNFSFGDYFKKEAIQMAWEFLTENIGLEKDKLYISVYEEDDEAYDIWKNMIGIPEERIERKGKEDNFWEIEEGPCGPCSEIHYDRGEKYEGDDRYLEIWNLVFTQFNKTKDGKYLPLDNPNIDTGMGLERLALILENAENIFELDTFRPLLKEIENISGKKYGKTEKIDESFRVIMDHTKSMTFLIYDGVIPSNEGRGYVLRRLIRRAYRHGKLLGIEGHFLEKLSQIVMDIYSSEYPEVLEDKDRVFKIINREESNFQQTIDQGLDILSQMIDKLEKNSLSKLSGKDAFKLYDTYGFPLDLTEEIVKDRNMSIDIEEFKNSMQQQRENARANKGFKGGWEEETLDVSSYPITEFLGYTEENSEGKIIDIISENGDKISEGQKGIVILDKTPFYAESGGQIGDTGFISSENGEMRVLDTKKTADVFYHMVEVENGEFRKGDLIISDIDRIRRKNIAKNHSATHLLNKALKTVLGNHINQAGSLVTDERLRFDFTHYEAISKEDLKQIEYLVNKSIYDSINVNIKETTLKESQEMGAIGLFEDKYKDIVRVVDMGGYSVELCGGTHVENTSQVMMFKIISESGIAAGVRRIEAISGFNVYKYINQKEEFDDLISEKLKSRKDSIAERIDSVLNENKEYKKELLKFKEMIENNTIESFDTKISNLEDINSLIIKLNNVDADSLKSMSDKIQQSKDNIVVLLASVIGDKVIYVSSVSKNLINRNIKAGDIVKFVAQYTDGNGGGRPDFAQAGGKNIEKVDEALLKVEDFIKEKLS